MSLLSFFLGVIVGLLLAILIVATLTYFKKFVIKQTEIIEKRLEIKGPQPRGFVFEPESEIDERRNEIIEKNKKEGRDTPIKDLI